MQSSSHQFEVDPDHIMKDIYSYPFPEVRQLLGGLSLAPEFMLNTLPAELAQQYLRPYDFRPPLELPIRDDYSLDLDELHVPVIDRIRQRIEPSLPGLAEYGNTYPTPGSSQAMFTLMAEWAAKGEVTSIATVNGDYEGYAAYAGSLRLPVNKYDSIDGQSPKPGELWFVSNPNARDGNFVEPEAWAEFTAAGHQIVYDAAYIGLTSEGSVDVSSPNIKAVLTSPSKVFGVFRYRNTGITYSRQPVTALYGSKWFKDVPAILDTLKLYETFTTNELPARYQKVQELLCSQLAEVVDAEVIPSDVLLLATSQGAVAEPYQRFMRAGKYRFGLTKLFEDYERFTTCQPDSAS